MAKVFSRLLNLTDGLMGQGHDVIVLITTNEPLSAMHPAVVRPGRCLSEMEFGPLSVEAANRWLGAHGSGVTVAKPTSLAELYAAIGDGKGIDQGVRKATARMRQWPRWLVGDFALATISKASFPLWSQALFSKRDGSAQLAALTIERPTRIARQRTVRSLQ